MVGSVNKVTLIGNVGKDPEVRAMQDGSKVVSITIATSENWKDKTTGEKREKTEWHRVVVFNDRIGDVIERFVKKGSKIYIEGQLQTRKWTDQAGVEKYTTEVVLQRYRGELTLLDSKGGSSHSSDSFGGHDDHHSAISSSHSGGGMTIDLDDEIPF